MQEKIFKAFIFALLAIAFVGLPFSFLAFGSDIQTRQSNLYPFQSMIALQDEFQGGVNTNGTVGQLGWIVSGGTTTNLSSETANPGLIRKATTAVSGTFAQLSLASSGNNIDPASPHSIAWITRLNTNDANTTVRYGAFTSTTSAPANGIYIEKLDADTNWFCITRAGGVQTRTDSGVATSTSFTRFSYTRNSSGVMFSINNSTNVCTHTTNIPTSFLNPAVQITNSSAADKTTDIDYFQLIISGLNR